MRAFIHLVVFSCLVIKSSSSNYILCTAQCPQITLSFSDPFTIPDICQENSHIPDIYQNALICTIDYRIDYDMKSIYVNFKASNDTNLYNVTDQSEFLVQSIWLGLTYEGQQPNLTHRKYGCNTNNDCARQFYFHTIQYLITNGTVELHRIQSKLYQRRSSIKPLTHYRCKDSNKTGNRSLVPCKNGLCYAHSANAKQYCTTDITPPTFFSEIEYHLPKTISDEREWIEYKCNKHLCNGNATMVIIQKYLRDYTNWYGGIGSKSLANHRTISYCLIGFSLLFFRSLF